MDEPADYGHALHHLARAQAVILTSSGDDLVESLTRFIEQKLTDVPPDYLMAVLEEHRLVGRHTHGMLPTRPGMYLKLSHGRRSVDEKINQWGHEGPWIGPLKWFHLTYMSSVSMGFEDGGEISPMVSDGELPSPIFLTKDFLYVSGMYYGDWELVKIGP